jgi:hypothetical protein
VKRKGENIVEGANQSKWQKGGGDTGDSNMKEEQEENLQPSRSHNILHCHCEDCDKEFFRRINRDDSDFDSDYDLDFN